MSYLRQHSRLLLVAVSCLAAGAGASAIASAGAATGSSTHAAGHRLHGGRHWLARAIHGNVVVATRHGYESVTFDRGKVVSVHGQQLTLTEGTPTSTYKTVTLTIPASARIRDNHQRTSLPNVTPGQHVMVITAPERTLVIAHDASQN